MKAKFIAFVTLGTMAAFSANAVPISINSLDTAITEDFNTLSSAGTSSTLPVGWSFSEAGQNANALYTANNGNSNTGDTYSYGATGSSDRAFGMLRSGNLIPMIGVGFRNLTGASITSVEVSYIGEQWRLGTAGRADRLDFQYSLDASSITLGTWTDVDELDFTTPNTTTTGQKDGNAAVNQTFISGAISSLDIADGMVFWLRWVDFDASGADDGLAIDDFSFTAHAPSGAVPDTGATAWLLAIPLLGLWTLRRRFSGVA